MGSHHPAAAALTNCSSAVSRLTSGFVKVERSLCHVYPRCNFGLRRSLDFSAMSANFVREDSCSRAVAMMAERNGIRAWRNVEARASAGGEAENDEKRGEVDYKRYQALMRGGEEVIAMMKEMTELLEDIAGMDKEEEEAAVRMAAAGAVGNKLEKLEGSFLMALDWMIEQADKEKDDKKKWLLDVIKETVLAQLSHKFPSQVQVVGTLCTTSCKDARQEILRRCAGGGGTFKTEGGGDLTLPAINLNEVASQADDIIMTMEEKPLVADRRLLAKLILVREEARSLMGGGILDKRNDNKGFKQLPETEVKRCFGVVIPLSSRTPAAVFVSVTADFSRILAFPLTFGRHLSPVHELVTFLSKLVGLRPGPLLRERLLNVMRGRDEGEETAPASSKNQSAPRRRLVSFDEKQAENPEEEFRPVRPGIFLETLTKVIAGMYESNAAGGVTVQQLEWIHKETLDILQEMAFSSS